MSINTRELLSEAKFFEGYSRYIEEEQRYETWNDSVKRVMNTHREKYADQLTETPKLRDYFDLAEKAYTEKKVLGAQRALQFGGPQVLKHQARMYNCSAGYADRAEMFGEFFYILLCGAGAGVSVQKHHVAKMPMIRPRTKQAKTHIVTDDIEGWSTALDVLMSSFFIGGGAYPEYEGRKVYFDTNNIRKKGDPISGGFKAPGPEPLVHALTLIERLLTEIAEEGVLRPIHVYDICMHAADAVLSGGVRRAATIFLFSKDDQEMLESKTGDWFTKNPQRARSNNSVVLKRDEISKDEFEAFFNHTKQFGEPGFVFVDSYEHVFNPCVEIGLLPYLEFEGKRLSGWEFCNLTEINGALCVTAEDFYHACKVAAILGTIQAGYTDFKFLTNITKQIVEREALLGVSLTGWMNNPEILFDKNVLKKGAKIVKEINKEVAALLGIKPAARTTCVKPAGNASVLLGTASGIHPEHSKRYLRNIQMNKMEEVADIFKKTNPYMVEESVWSKLKTDYIISFPITVKKTSILKKHITALDLLEKVKFVQQYWVREGKNEEYCVDPTINHNVSNTIHVNENEWEEVCTYIFTNRHMFTAVSLIAASGDKDYNQAPNTEVLTAAEIVSKYGDAGIFASGLIVDAKEGFSNLWEACQISIYNGDDADQEMKDARANWIRRFNKFAQNYFSGDKVTASYCLKDVYLLHKWTKITQSFVEPKLEEKLKTVKNIDIDTMGAIACHAGGCEI